MRSVALLALGIVLLDTGLLLAHPSPPVAIAAWLSLAVLALPIALDWNDVRRARRAALAGPPQRFPLRALDQEQYAALLRAEADRRKQFETIGFTKGYACKRCRRGARVVKIDHPIWDGPFEGGGSGSVDTRILFWCLACDGPPPPQAGPAVRLPFLDNLPIRLLPALYERPAFRSLPDPVELYIPPPPQPLAPIEAAAPQKETQ